MQLGELAAVVLQTFLMVLFVAVLTPLRLPEKRTAVISLGLALALCALAGFLFAWRGLVFLTTYGFLFVSPLLFIAFRLFSSVGGIRYLFVVLTAFLFHQMLSTLLSAFRIWAGGRFTMLYLLLNLLVFGLLLTGGIAIRRDFHKIVLAYRYEFICLTPIFALLLGMSLLFSPVGQERGKLDPDLLLITLGLDLLTILFYLYVGVSFHSLGKLCDDTREATALRLQMQETQEHIALLRTAQERAAFYRHDLRHHVTLIRAFLDNGETDQLRSYLDDIQTELDGDTPERFCQNEAANLLLFSFMAKAAEAGVRLLADAQIPHSLPIGTPALCTLLSNALENAVSAAAKAGADTEKAVHLTTRLEDGKLLLLVENPYMGEVRLENGLPRSNRPGHGLGISSMESIVKKYGGLSSYQARDGRFTVRIVI